MLGWVDGSGFRASLGRVVSGFEFRAWGLGLRMKGLWV